MRRGRERLGDSNIAWGRGEERALIILGHMDSFLAAIDGVSLEEKEGNVANGYDQTESSKLNPRKHD